MSEQGFSAQEQEDDYAQEPELDEYTRRENEHRSGYFLAALCFLIALLCLAALFNHAFLYPTLLQLGALIFGAMGIFFVVRSQATMGHGVDVRSLPHEDPRHPEGKDPGELEAGGDGDGDESEDEGELTPFEQLVHEALASIPEEFQERMESVFVRVVYEPAEEVLRRVGAKEGYTLLGLYEGVPLTTFGYRYSAQPQVITIYQRTIEAYCHGDAERIREQVRRTVLHEVAHHFGIDHDMMPIWIR